LVYTNKIASSAMRGYGNAEAHFAVESMMDALAESLGMDPAEIRLRNAPEAGDVTVHGWKLGSCGLKEAIRASAREAEWQAKRGRMHDRRRGVGMACGIHVSGNRALSPAGDGSSCQVRIYEDGSICVASGEGDLGQGSKTIIAQIVAEELGVAYENVQVAQLDTALTPGGIGCIASRTTVLAGNAARLAAQRARTLLIEAAADRWGCPSEQVHMTEGRLVNPATEEEMTLPEAATHHVGMSGGSRLLAEGNFRAEGIVVPDKTKYGNISLAYAYAAQIAEVEVDPETGAVTVLRIVAAHDAGTVLNPMLCEGQIEGGVVQGMGKALYEEYVFKDGGILNPNFTDYRVPTALDVPAIKVVFVETADPHGPYGAKSVGELALVPTPAAIANAIYDAVGVRLTTLPMTPERVLEALKQRRPPVSPIMPPGNSGTADPNRSEETDGR
jgi:CO/xanthine dehydrogenase Mo-binding subunit